MESTPASEVITKREMIDGRLHIVIEGTNATAVEAEMHRWMHMAEFIGPYKVVSKYVAKGMMRAV